MSIATNLNLVGSSGAVSLSPAEELSDLDYTLALGGVPAETSKSTFNFFLIIVTAMLFITVITWVNVISRFYEDTFNPSNEENRYKTTFLSFGYAIIITLITIFIYILYQQQK